MVPRSYTVPKLVSSSTRFNCIVLRIRIAFTLFLFLHMRTLVYILSAYALSDGLAAIGAIWPTPLIITVVIIAIVGYCKRLFDIRMRFR